MCGCVHETKGLGRRGFSALLIVIALSILFAGASLGAIPFHRRTDWQNTGSVRRCDPRRENPNHRPRHRCNAVCYFG